MTKCNPAFFLSKLHIKGTTERRLVQNTENSSGQQSHFNDFTGHLQVLIVIIHNLPGGPMREAAKFVGKIVFQACKFWCKYTLFKFNLNKECVPGETVKHKKSPAYECTGLSNYKEVNMLFFLSARGRKLNWIVVCTIEILGKLFLLFNDFTNCFV